MDSKIEENNFLIYVIFIILFITLILFGLYLSKKNKLIMKKGTEIYCEDQKPLLVVLKDTYLNDIVKAENFKQ